MVIESLRKNILGQFDLMSEVISRDFDEASYELSGTRLKEEFLKKISKLEKLYSLGKINPYVSLNLNIGEDSPVSDRPVKIAFFPFAGNPPHWGHLMSAFDALIDLELDKIIFVSNGNDFRKPDLPPAEMRYSLIEDAINLFSPFFEFSRIAEKPFFDESIPLIGEYTLFKFFKINPNSEITAYYFAGSDHLNRSVIKNGKEQLDVIGNFEKCIEEKLLGFNKNKHKIIGLFSARDKEEFERNILKIHKPLIDLVRLNPTISFSSTELRDALQKDAPTSVLVLLPYVNYLKIKENKWYKN
jgi:nicotinic acid mononucleotide adenylyltransferase